MKVTGSFISISSDLCFYQGETMTHALLWMLQGFGKYGLLLSLTREKNVMIIKRMMIMVMRA